MYTVNENDLKRTMVEVLKADGHNTLANMLEMSKLVYDPQWEFSGIISYQRKLYVSLRVPLNFRTYATQHRELLSKTCLDIYIDDDEYACYGIKDIPYALAQSSLRRPSSTAFHKPTLAPTSFRLVFYWAGC